MPGNDNEPELTPEQRQITDQFLGSPLEEISPPGGITHRAGEPLPRHVTCADATSVTIMANELRNAGATLLPLGEDGRTIWFTGDIDAIRRRLPDDIRRKMEPALSGHWGPVTPDAVRDAAAQAEAAASARQLQQAMDDLLAFAKSTDARNAGAYEPAIFAQEIVGLGKAVDGKLAVYQAERMPIPASVFMAKADMVQYQGEMEDCAALARDAEALFYDIQAHTGQVEWDATQRLMSKTRPEGPMSETAARKSISILDDTCRRHDTLVRMAGRVKARALDLYGISRRRLRTAQKCVDTFTGKSDDE